MTEPRTESFQARCPECRCIGPYRIVTTALETGEFKPQRGQCDRCGYTPDLTGQPPFRWPYRVVLKP